MSSRTQYEHESIDTFFSDATVTVDAPRYQSRSSKEYSRWKTAKGVVYVLGGVALVSLVVGVAGYSNSVAGALAFKTETTGKVVDAGIAEIVEVDMDIPPITLATAETKVTGVKVAFEQKLTGLFDISLGETTVTRDATVETEITVDPGKVHVSYDAENDQLTFSALDTALSTDVAIPTGAAKTVDKTGSIAMLPAEWLTKVSEAIDGTFGTDNSTVPIVREMAAGTLAINEGLEKYADLNIVTQVDKECTPLIPREVVDFTQQLKDNFRTSIQLNQLVPVLKDMPLSEVQKLVDNSIVEIPADFAIGPDQESVDELADYKKSKFFTSTLEPDSPIACGISKDTKLSLVSEGNK